MLTASADAAATLDRSVDRCGTLQETLFSRYAALGDSFTAGRSPDGRRWTDEVAAHLASRNPALTHVNFARSGATSADLVETQLPRALEFEPDLVTLICGLNDVLLVRQPDFAAYAARFAHMAEMLRQLSSGVVIVTATCPNKAGMLPLTLRARQRLVNAIELLNEVTRSVSCRLAVPYVEFGTKPPVREVSPSADLAISCDPSDACADKVTAFTEAIQSVAGIPMVLSA
jgi:lysophospholipase L1-like esterase